MNLFISWSGERSEIVARSLHPWIKCIIQTIVPFFSPRDISGGSIWINKLNEKLASSNAGVICLTPENQHESWIQFEAGALAKGLTENRVFILLIGMESHEVTGPLASFNHTLSTKEEIRKMVYNLNELINEKKLDSEILDRVFEKNYEDFEIELKAAIQSTKITKAKKRDQSDIQIEMLDLLRGLSSRVSHIESKVNMSQHLSLSKSELQNLARIGRLDDTIDSSTTTTTTSLSELFKIGEKLRQDPEKREHLAKIFKRFKDQNSGSSENGGGI